MTARMRVTAYAGILCSCVAVILVTAAPWHTLRLVGAFLMATVPPGAAILCWIDTGDSVVQAGLVLVTSLAVFALSAAVMIWVSAWHPMAPFLILAGLSIGVPIVRLGSRVDDRGARRIYGPPPEASSRRAR